MCKHANAFVWGFLWWAVSLKSSTMKSKTDELSKNIQNVSNSSIYSYILKSKVLRSDMTLYQNLDDFFSVKVGHSFEIRNPWKGRSVHLQLDGDINPSKNSWMRKCNIFDCKYTSHPLEILEFTLTFQIKKSPKLFSLACMVILLIECYFWK